MSKMGAVKKIVKNINRETRGINIPPQATIPKMPPVKEPKKNI